MVFTLLRIARNFRVRYHLPLAGFSRTRWPRRSSCFSSSMVGPLVVAVLLTLGEAEGVAQGPPPLVAKSAAAEVALPTLSVTERDALIEQLGSAKFAVREEALARLKQVGATMLPRLRMAATEHSDPEIRARAMSIYHHIVDGDFEARATSFLAGNDVGDSFSGWLYVSSLMDDNAELREIFVAASRKYPQLLDALDGTARDRTLELEHVTHRMGRLMTEQMQVPEREDLLVILWVVADPNVPISAEVQTLTMSLLRRSLANDLRKNAQLNDPFRMLVGNWIRRSRVDHARDTLWLAMQWDMGPEAQTLALRAAYEARDAENVQAGLQAMARFGSADDAPAVRPFLDDDRVVEEEAGRPIEVRTSDVAMAAIATLYKVPLKEVGFPLAIEHRKIAFDVSSVGFPTDRDETRQKTRKQIEKLLQQHGHAPVAQPLQPPRLP